ncbi:MAG: DUF3568 family protein [Phycisphaerales bacterium]|nr:DUF3568 family protein [Phycisphaerales bacterium]
MHLVRLVHLAFTCLLAGSLLIGCELSSDRHGWSGIEAPYLATGQLAAEIRRDPPTVAAAFTETIRAMGYAVMSHRVTAGEAKITGKSADRTVRITITRCQGGSRVVIQTGLLGDEVISRDILDGALQRLGLW